MGRPALVILLGLAGALTVASILGYDDSPASSLSRETADTLVRLPVLDFPEPGLDDTAAYQGYQTRFYRDSRENAVQVYAQPRSARVVLLWANGSNESVGFTVRDGQGQPAALTWGGDTARVSESGKTRSIELGLVAHAAQVELGWFLLGSMRVERDFQNASRHLVPFAGPAFVVAEESLLVDDVARLPPDVRRRHLELLQADSISELRSRLQPVIAADSAAGTTSVSVLRPSLDGRNYLALTLTVDSKQATMRPTTRTVSFRSRSSSPVRLTLRVATDAPALTPLSRAQIFNREFLEFLAGTRTGGDTEATTRYRRLERQVKAVELLSSEEKLMAGLPNFATYFGRDMMVTALMMRSIWTPTMSEHVIGSVLRKLGPDAEVSHEEALGGQAIRENAVVYDSLVKQYLRVSRRGQDRRAEAILTRAARVLAQLQATRENYHMIDDEFQLPVLVAGYLSDADLTRDRKRAFLLDTVAGRGSRLELLLRELALIASWTRPYVDRPRAENLVSFPPRDSLKWRSASWRDSDAGYAGGRFAMDVNVIWAPAALEAMATIFSALPDLGFSLRRADSIAPEIRGTPLIAYLRDSSSLGRAIEVWHGARRHFSVTLAPPELRHRIASKLAWLPPAERRYWEGVMRNKVSGKDSLPFLALSLDAKGRPIPVVNTDPATELLLRSFTEEIEGGGIEPEEVLRELEPFMQLYPVGLFVEGIGPLVANDAYASRRIWERFRADPYHGPQVVWGREVNLLLLGLARQIGDAYDGSDRLDDASLAGYVQALDQTVRRTLAAVEASGLGYNELWSYRIEGGRLQPIRYGTSSDIQLWNTTDLAVEFMLSRLPRP
jgi:hypothetical protein